MLDTKKIYAFKADVDGDQYDGASLNELLAPDTGSLYVEGFTEEDFFDIEDDKSYNYYRTFPATMPRVGGKPL